LKYRLSPPKAEANAPEGADVAIIRREPKPLLANVVEAGSFVVTAGCIAEDAWRFSVCEAKMDFPNCGERWLTG
jgi:hypothetical protein